MPIVDKEKKKKKTSDENYTCSKIKQWMEHLNDKLWFPFIAYKSHETCVYNWETWRSL